MSYIVTALASFAVGASCGLIFAAAAIRNNKARAAKLEAELAAISKVFRK